HHDPIRSLSDGAQALTFEMFEEMMGELIRVSDAMDRPLLVEPYKQLQHKNGERKVIPSNV
ncbi:MAG TPA: hypothetical protein VFO76_10875, partial [Candidatus Kapabacteria bacterium]|nr:hypothetical protein [Candidatus Kapabacteria bacterium]